MSKNTTNTILDNILPIDSKRGVPEGYSAFRIAIAANGFDPKTGYMEDFFAAQINRQRTEYKAAKAELDAGKIKDDNERLHRYEIFLKSSTLLLIPNQKVSVLMSYSRGMVCDGLMDRMIKGGAMLHSLNGQSANRVYDYDVRDDSVRDVTEYCDMGPLSRDPQKGPAAIWAENGVAHDWAFLFPRNKVEAPDGAKQQLAAAVAAQISYSMSNENSFVPQMSSLRAQQIRAHILEKYGINVR